MPFQPITNSEIATGAIIDTDLLGKVKNDFDVHEESIGTLNVQTAALAAAPSPVIIGTIVHSMLTLTQYQSLAGSGWVLANGQSCVGSAYHTLTGFTTVPDIRGKSLRGKNNGASGAGYNPDGDLAVGTYQADELASHRHTLSYTGNYTGTWGNAPVPFHNTPGGTSSNISSIMGYTGGNETRMKNITVNIFIKIN